MISSIDYNYDERGPSFNIHGYYEGGLNVEYLRLLCQRFSVKNMFCYIDSSYDVSMDLLKIDIELRDTYRGEGYGILDIITRQNSDGNMKEFLYELWEFTR